MDTTWKKEARKTKASMGGWDSGYGTHICKVTAGTHNLPVSHKMWSRLQLLVTHPQYRKALSEEGKECISASKYTAGHILEKAHTTYPCPDVLPTTTRASSGSLVLCTSARKQPSLSVICNKTSILDVFHKECNTYLTHVCSISAVLKHHGENKTRSFQSLISTGMCHTLLRFPSYFFLIFL